MLALGTDPRPATARPIDDRSADLHLVGTVRRDDVDWFKDAVERAIACTAGDLTLGLHEVDFREPRGS